MRQIHAAKTGFEVIFMQRLDLLQLPLQGADQVFGQHRHPVFVALAFPNHNFTPRKLHVFDTQAQRFEQTHARVIQQLRNQPCRACIWPSHHRKRPRCRSIRLRRLTLCQIPPYLRVDGV